MTNRYHGRHARPSSPSARGVGTRVPKPVRALAAVAALSLGAVGGTLGLSATLAAPASAATQANPFGPIAQHTPTFEQINQQINQQRSWNDWWSCQANYYHPLGPRAEEAYPSNKNSGGGSRYPDNPDDGSSPDDWPAPVFEDTQDA